MKIDDFQSPFGSTQVIQFVVSILNHVNSKKTKTVNIEYDWGFVAKVGGNKYFRAGLVPAGPVPWEG